MAKVTITGSSSSSMTSTSHTMTAFPLSQKPNQSTAPLTDLLKALAPENRHAFITPNSHLPNASLGFAKATLDDFAAMLGDEQAERLKEERRKRKRGERDVGDGEVLKIRRVHTEGFEVEQVWEQTKRVIDALRGDVERSLQELGRAFEDLGSEIEAEFTDDENQRRFAEQGYESEPRDGYIVTSEEEGSGSGYGDDFQSALEHEGDFDPDEPIGEDGADGEERNALGGDVNGSGTEDEAAAGVFAEDAHGLNDGFFSIDDFNKQTEFLEQADARADPYTGEASDEEEVDWDADPMTMAAGPSSSKRAVRSEDSEEEEDDENGPTFGNVDLNAPEGDSDEEDGSTNNNMDTTADNTNDILYKDFFEPPPRKIGKGERQAQFLQRQSEKAKASKPEDDEAEMERAIADVRRDLFDDLSDHENSEDALSDVEAGDVKSRKSAHERRQAKLAEEIRRLEAASVAKREWTLSGEARAAERPMNSLIEEDLDFERTGKPVPVITAEVSENIEELIKRRILAQEFDEVIRRRPDSINTSSNPRRGLFELDDSKPQQSLAEMYEEEHVKANNPDSYISKPDEKIRKEEAEVATLWKDISAKLDALSSWHYTPKPAAPSLTVVADVATISMEDAQPATASGMAGGMSMLAPQEVYKAGKRSVAGGGTETEKGEVVLRSGVPVARAEMTREQKVRRRRREKERIKKADRLDGGRPGGKKEGKKDQERRETVGELKRGGVKVIGKKGEVRDVEGNRVRSGGVGGSSASFKL